MTVKAKNNKSVLLVTHLKLVLNTLIKSYQARLIQGLQTYISLAHTNKGLYKEGLYVERLTLS